MSFIEQSHPEHTTEVREELVQLAANIAAWQEGVKPRLSDEALLRQYPALGSTKTWRKIRKGDFESLVPENHLPKYRGVWAQVETASGAAAQEDLYEDLAPAAHCSLAIAGASPQQGNARLVIIEGPTGSGKSSAIKIITAKYSGSVARTEATECWDSLHCALGDILAAIIGGESPDLPGKMSARLDQIILRLNQGRKILIIDEGHHCTAKVLNTIKTIINKTSSIVVIAAIDTIWKKLTARSWDEARQLIHNRTYERVRLAQPTKADVETFLSRRCPSLNGGDWKQAAGKVAMMSGHLGHFAFLRRVSEKINSEHGEPDAGAILEAAANLKANLETR